MGSRDKYGGAATVRQHCSPKPPPYKRAGSGGTWEPPLLFPLLPNNSTMSCSKHTNCRDSGRNRALSLIFQAQPLVVPLVTKY